MWPKLTFIGLIIVCSMVSGNPDAKRLYDDLLSSYNKLVRPVVNTSDVLRVSIKLKLSQLIDVVSNPSNITVHDINNILKRNTILYNSVLHTEPRALYRCTRSFEKNKTRKGLKKKSFVVETSAVKICEMQSVCTLFKKKKVWKPLRYTL